MRKRQMPAGSEAVSGIAMPSALTATADTTPLRRALVRSRTEEPVTIDTPLSTGLSPMSQEQAVTPCLRVVHLVAWRREWDSNPRWTCAHAGFQDRCLKPLGHPSGARLLARFGQGNKDGNKDRIAQPQAALNERNATRQTVKRDIVA